MGEKTMVPIGGKAIALKAGNKRTQNAYTSSRVLVVDDNHQTVVAVSLMLEALGYRIDAANCGIAALSCLNRYNYDIVLTDLEMPDMMGNVLAAEIREKWPDTGVIIMTGGSHEEIEDYRQNGPAEHWIFKPFNMVALERMLNNISHPDFNEVAYGHA